MVSVICYDDPTIADLPEGVHKDLLGILTKKILSLTGDCDEPELEDINLHLYTRTNQNESIILNPRKPSEIDGNKKFVLIIHGWISSVDAEGVQQLKDAYLRRYDADIVVLDWSKLAKSFYATSVCSLPKIAKLVGDFLCLLDEENNLLLSEVHVVGHSLGGQMSGFIGNRTMEKCQQKIGRITGLDPAGPLFQGLAPEQRLEASDAEFVDIIHTNQGLFGYWGESGHADFYVNCGIYQMGCPDISFTLDGIKNLPFSTGKTSVLFRKSNINGQV